MSVVGREQKTEKLQERKNDVGRFSGSDTILENKGKAKHREAEKKRKNTGKVKDYIVTDYC